MNGPLLKYLDDRCGAAGAEFALLALVFAMVLLGIIDFNRALWEYNEIEKSCRVGVRYAVVHNMVATGMYTWDGAAGGILAPGDAVPASGAGAIDPSTANCTCSNISGDPPVCGSVTCDNWGPPNQAAFDDILREMEAVYSGLNAPETVISVKYENIGLGIAGNPIGSDVSPLTTVTVQGPTMDFSTPLIDGIAGPIQFNCSASLTGEDFQTCPDGVSQLPCP